jgi:hypothetical protein
LHWEKTLGGVLAVRPCLAGAENDVGYGSCGSNADTVPLSLSRDSHFITSDSSVSFWTGLETSAAGAAAAGSPLGFESAEDTTIPLLIIFVSTETEMAHVRQGKRSLNVSAAWNALKLDLNNAK